MHIQNLYVLIELIRLKKPIISTDFYGFAVFLRRYCFQNFSREGIDAELERVKLVELIFFPTNEINYFEEYIILPFNEMNFSIPNPHRLFVLLYLSIFEDMILKQGNIKNLRKLLKKNKF